MVGCAGLGYLKGYAVKGRGLRQRMSQLWGLRHPGSHLGGRNVFRVDFRWSINLNGTLCPYLKGQGDLVSLRLTSARSRGIYPRGSKDPNNRALGPKY